MTAASDAKAAFQAGALVKLHGLKTRSDLNGKEASVIQLCASGRIAIKTADGDCIRVRAQNLEAGQEPVMDALEAESFVAPTEAPGAKATAPVETANLTCAEGCKEPTTDACCESSTGSSFRAYFDQAVDSAATTFTGSLISIATVAGVVVGFVETKLLTKALK